MTRLKVLLTGPSGRIGGEMLPRLRERYDLRTFDLQADANDANDANAFEGDLQDIEVLKAAMQGCDCVIHLAATSDEAPFLEKLVPNNIIGIHHVLEAAHQSGVKRVVFAGSVQSIGRGMHGEGRAPFEAHEPPRPSSIYGATKVWGEALGRYFSDKYGLEFISIRIGAFQPYDSDWFKEGRARDIWLSPRDMFQLLWRAVETPDVVYAIVHGTSQVPRERMSLREAREILGYQPIDNADDFFAAKS